MFPKANNNSNILNELFFSEPHNSGTIEHVVIIRGRARLSTANDLHKLSEGDYITYPGDRPHMFEALEPNTKAMLISEHR